MTNDATSGPPVFRWLSGYRAEWLRPDVVAGVLLAAYLVPVSLAYATLAGLPPQAGLYSSMLAGVAFAAFSSGRHTAIAVTSAISLLIGSVLGEMSGGDPQRQMWLASLAALYVGIVAVAARLLRAGSVVAFISETILAGFKVGVAVHITVSQLPKLLGVKASGDHMAQKLMSMLGQLDAVHWPTLLLGSAALLLIALGERFLKNRPVALFVMALSIVAMTFTPLGQMGIKVMGELPAGLPALGTPPIRGREVDGLFGLALACFLLATVETMAVARTFGLKHGYRVDTNREFLAIGAANLVVGLAQGYPVSGGMSQSAVNESAGARTPLSLVVACVLVGLVALALGGLFRQLPDAVLAAVVLMAIRGLLDLSVLRQLWRFSRFEFAVALVALVGVLSLGVLKGVLIAVIFSVMLLLNRAARPPLLVLGRLPGTRAYVGLARDREAVRVPGALLVRIYGALLYFNVDAVREQLMALWRDEGRPPLVVLDLAPVPWVDLAGAKLLCELRATMTESGSELRVAEARLAVRDALGAVEEGRPRWTSDLGHSLHVVLVGRE